MRATRFGSTLCLLLIAVFAISQPKNLKELKIGDQVPDVEIKNIVNYTKSSARFSDFKGKLLILDFWATWCSPCISAMPKLDSLQKEFNGKLTIIGVTYETADVAVPMINKLKEKKQINPVSVVADKDLKRMFPHTSLPHYVWIDEYQRVVAITEGSEVTSANVRAILNKAEVNFVVKKDQKHDIVYDSKSGESMFQPSVKRRQPDGSINVSTLPSDDLVIHSTLTRYIPGVASGADIGPNSLRVSNRTIRGLYQVALWHWRDDMFNDSKTIIDIQDSVLYNKITKPENVAAGIQYVTWLKDNNGYCYELRTPESMKESRFDIMTYELNRYFGAEYGIEGVIEKRNQKYLALVRTSQEDRMATKGGKKGHKQDKFTLMVQNYPIRSVIVLLRQPLQLSPFIVDETNYSGNVDLNIDCQLSDLSALNKELEKYGLKLVEKERLDEIAVIRIKK